MQLHYCVIHLFNICYTHRYKSGICEKNASVGKLHTTHAPMKEGEERTSVYYGEYLEALATFSCHESTTHLILRSSSS